MLDKFGVSYGSDRVENGLKGDCKRYAGKIGAERVARIGEEKMKYYHQLQELNATIEATTKNKRIKNKQISHKVLADRYRALFNYRSLDYYMYRLGVDSLITSTTKVGVEYELHELYDEASYMLLALGEYKGYGSIHWMYGCGCHAWEAAGEPDFPEKDSYLREDLGILLY